MRFVEGCDFQEFSRYLVRLGLYTGKGELDGLRSHLESGRFNLIVFRENGEIIGHAVWHETNTEEHRKGASLERRKTKRSCTGSSGKRRISSNSMSYG